MVAMQHEEEAREAREERQSSVVVVGYLFKLGPQLIFRIQAGGMSVSESFIPLRYQGRVSSSKPKRSQRQPHDMARLSSTNPSAAHVPSVTAIDLDRMVQRLQTRIRDPDISEPRAFFLREKFGTVCVASFFISND